MKTPVKLAINLFLIALVYLGITNHSIPQDVDAACNINPPPPPPPPPSGDSASDCLAAGYGYSSCGLGDGDTY